MGERRFISPAVCVAAILGGLALAWNLHRRIVQIESVTPSEAEIVRARSELRQLSETADALGKEQAAQARNAEAAERRAIQSTELRAKTERWNVQLQDPAFRAILRKQMSVLLLPKFESLLRSLRLSPADVHSFMDLVVDKQLAKADALTVAMVDGMSVPTLSPEYLKVVNDAQTDANQKLSDLLGNTDYATYQHFEETYGLRSYLTTMNLLSGELPSVSGDQVQKLLDAWYSALPASQQGNTTGSGINMLQSMNPSDFTPPLPDNAVELARPILTLEQMPAVERLVETIQAQRRLYARPR